MSYDRLTTTAFHLRPEGIERLWGRHWAMDFPRTWLERITGLLRDLSRREHHGIPIVRLNQAIRGLVPDVVAVGRNVHRMRHTGGWLYSTVDVDPVNLEPILHAWIPTLHRDLGLERADELWRGLAMRDLVWRELDDGELGWPTSSSAPPETPEATAAVAGLPRPLFHLVPELLAATLLQRSDRPAGFARGFRCCPTTDGQGVELVSWPPLGMDRGRMWPYSYLVTLTIQTLPFIHEPRLNVEVGVRRWWPRPPANAGRNISMYLLTAVPWLRGLHNSSSFHVAPVRWRWTEGTWTLAWQKEVAEILHRVHLDRPLPEPAEVGSDPVRFLEGEPAAALVYATSSGWAHEAQAGASARDRDHVVGWIRDALDDVLEPVPPLQRVPFRVLGAKAGAPDACAKRAAIAQALGDDRMLRVDLDTDTEAVRDALVAEVTGDLGLDTGQAVETAAGRCWETPELTVILRERQIGRLASELDMEGGRPRARAEQRERIRRAVHRRRTEVVAHEGTAVGRTIAIVEVQEREAFEAGADPKAALRLGLADTGRLSQFINPLATGGSKSGLRHRAESAWSDALRQLSGRLLPLRPRLHGVTLPDPVDHVAIWMVRRNATRSSWDMHRLPVAVWTSSDREGVWARAFGMRKWKPYPEVLLEVTARSAGDMPPDCDDRSVSGFVEDVLQDVQSDRPVLLLTCAQNLRDGWKWLANSRMAIDRIGFGDKVLPIGDFPGLRHVRVRLGSDHETPECYGIADGGFGLPSGLWRIPGSDRTFASTMPRPDSARHHGSPEGSRFEARETKDGGSFIEDRKPAWNPGLVELTAAAIQEGDDPLTWIALAHAMRRVSETYMGDLALPLQLHLAALVREYAMPGTDDADLPDDDPERQTLMNRI